MFARRLRVAWKDESGAEQPCPVAWIDNFAMRNFTNNVIYDDTLPVADGELEAGYRVPLDGLRADMEDWFRRKGYLKGDSVLVVKEVLAKSQGGRCDRSAMQVLRYAQDDKSLF